MIIGHRRGADVFSLGLKHIVAGVPLDGRNRRWGIGGAFINHGWLDLPNLEGELGDTLSAEIGGVNYYAIICYAWGVGGWEKAPQFVESALNEIGRKVGVEESIALVPPGHNQGQAYGADWTKIQAAIEASTTRVTLYTLG